MLGLLYFILCSYGLTQILCYAKILNSIRPSHPFFSCPMCVGFWVGIFLFSINSSTELFSFDYSLANVPLLGCLSSGTSYIMNMLFGDSGFNINKK